MCFEVHLHVHIDVAAETLSLLLTFICNSLNAMYSNVQKQLYLIQQWHAQKLILLMVQNQNGTKIRCSISTLDFCVNHLYNVFESVEYFELIQ